jgi:succinoglycan biosynthesis transport protein ExoP
MNILGRSLQPSSDQAPAPPVLSLSEPLFPEFSGETIDGLRHLVTRLLQKDKLPERLSIVSALRQEGVSYLAQALAATLAHDLNARVCLLDLNYWWPNERIQSEESQRSLSAVIAGQTSLEDALVRISWPEIAILPAGEIPRHSRSKAAHSQEIRELIDSLQKQFDHLILDVPAILSTPDSVALASLSDSACLVIRQGVTRKSDVSQALDEIEHLDVVGVIMNQVRLSTPAWLVKMLAT